MLSAAPPSLPAHLVLDLHVQEMYFAAACSSHDVARECYRIIDEKPGRLDFLWVAEAYDRGECIDDDDLFRDGRNAEAALQEVYGRFLQALVMTQILCAMTLESHINAAAQEKLEGKSWEAFDKLSIEGKWLLLPRIVGGRGFEAGHEPFQSFSALIARRNGLVHAKKEYLHHALARKSGTPGDLLVVGLKDAAASVATAKAMVKHLANMLGQEVPSWVDRSKATFYSVSPVEVA